MTRFAILAIIAILVSSCSPTQPAPSPIPAQPTAVPAAAPPAPTATSLAPTAAPTAIPATATVAAAPSRSVVGVWVDMAQPETIQVEFLGNGQVQFRMRIKSTIQGQAPTYGDWSTVATVPWQQTEPNRLELGIDDKREIWQIDWSRPALLQPKSTGGTTEFVRP